MTKYMRKFVVLSILVCRAVSKGFRKFITARVLGIIFRIGLAIGKGRSFLSNLSKPQYESFWVLLISQILVRWWNQSRMSPRKWFILSWTILDATLCSSIQKDSWAFEWNIGIPSVMAPTLENQTEWCARGGGSSHFFFTVSTLRISSFPRFHL